MAGKLNLGDFLEKHEQDLLAEWIRAQYASGHRRDLIQEAELREQSAELLRLTKTALKKSGSTDIQQPEWEEVREMLVRTSRARGLQGFTPSETATFVFSLKRPLFNRLRQELQQDAAALGEGLWDFTELMDRLGLLTTEASQKARDEVIARQAEDMLELSTPVVTLWHGILALPLIGTLDSSRTQTVMETLLQKIVETESQIAIIDITGVPTVDTLTAQHLLKTITATRLMGADCIISGIRPQIAQTIVHLGVNLGDVTTKSSLSAAFALALHKTGAVITRAPKGTV